MEENAKVTNVSVNYDNVDNDNSNKYHYIGVIFENKYSDIPYSGKVYEYKTTKNLERGQVIKIKTQYGESNVCIVKDNIPESDLQFKELDKIKEI